MKIRLLILIITLFSELTAFCDILKISESNNCTESLIEKDNYDNYYFDSPNEVNSPINIDGEMSNLNIKEESLNFYYSQFDDCSFDEKDDLIESSLIHRIPCIGDKFSLIIRYNLSDGLPSIFIIELYEMDENNAPILIYDFCDPFDSKKDDILYENGEEIDFILLENSKNRVMLYEDGNIIVDLNNTSPTKSRMFKVDSKFSQQNVTMFNKLKTEILILLTRKKLKEILNY